MKPEFFRDKKLGALGPVAALVYQALWLVADDGGMAQCDPELLKGEMFTYWGAVGVPEITEALRHLSGKSRIEFYLTGDMTFCQIMRWEKHQHVHKPSAFRYREHHKDLAKGVPEWCRTPLVVVRESPDSVSPTPPSPYSQKASA